MDQIDKNFPPETAPAYVEVRIKNSGKKNCLQTPPVKRHTRQ